MITARCFGGVLDGTWRAIDGRELIAPAPDMMAAQYIGSNDLLPDPWDLLSPSFPIHRYTLQRFVVGMEWVIFYALIGPGFTVKMVEAWLQGWIDEAGKLSDRAYDRTVTAMVENGGTLTMGGTKMQTVQGNTIRSHVAELERRLENQKATIRQLAADLRDAQADLRGIRTVRDNAVAAQVRIREKMQEHLRARLKAENSLTEARRQRWVQARRAERAEAALHPFGPGYVKERIKALHRTLAGAQEDRRQLRQQRNRAHRALSDIVDSARRSLDGGSAIAGLYWAIDRATQVLEK